MPTIRDVAKIAKVSTATVSYVLNDSRPVLPKTRRQVLNAIKRLNYRPSAIARSLTTSVTRSIGVVVADITNPFFAAIVRGIEDRLEARGYNLIVCNTDEQADREARYLELLLARRVDGLIIAPTAERQPLLREFQSLNIPLVFIDRQPPEKFGPVVAVDNFAAGYLATEHLLRLGHRRIAVLVRHLNLSTATGRVAGYRQALRDHRVRAVRSLVCVTDHTMDAVCVAARQLFVTSPRPTAIIATNQVMTLALLKVMQEQGAHCPDDLSLLAFDDNPWAELFTPPLTAIRQPISELCDAAITTLSRAMEQTKQKNLYAERLPDVLLKAELIVRASCRQI